MANLRTIQFLRNASLYSSLEEAKSGLNTQANSCLDGSPIAGRYTAQTGETASDTEVRTIFGIVHVADNVHTVSFFMNEYEFDNVLDGLDYGPIGGTDASVLTQIQQADGKISGLTANVGNLVLTDYVKGSDSGSVASTDSINEAFSKLEKQIDAEKDARAAAIDALDYTCDTLGDSEVFATITEENGVIAATGKNLSGIKLAVYAEGTDADIAATDTLGEALGKLQAQINAMDLTEVSGEGEVITAVSEDDGKVSASKAAIKDVKLTGYVKDTTKTGAIAATDDVEDALSKIENQIGANTVTNADGSITVTTTGATTDVAVSIKGGEHVLAKDGNAGLYTDLDLVKITTGLPETVKERYQFLATDNSQIGTNIDIPKDSHIVSIEYSGSTQKLYYTYIDVSGETKTTEVDMSELVLETEFGSGVTVTDHVAHGVVDPSSESFFTVGADGFKVARISGFVQTEIEKLDATVGSQTIATGKHVAVEVVEADGKLSGLTVVEDDIASAQGLADEITARTNADTELSNRIGTGVTANTATAQLIALSGDTNSVSGDTSVEGAKRYADAILANSVAGLDADVSGNSTHVTVGVVEENGVITAVTVSESDIANATDLATLSGKTVTEIGSSDNSISAVSSSASDGTVKYDIVTDGGKIKATGFDASASSGTPAASDSVSTVLSKLYANAKMDAVKAGSATTVVAAAGGTTVDVKLDTTSALSVNNNDDNGNNALMITSESVIPIKRLGLWNFLIIR